MPADARTASPVFAGLDAGAPEAAGDAPDAAGDALDAAGAAPEAAPPPLMLPSADIVNPLMGCPPVLHPLTYAADSKIFHREHT